MKKRVLVGLIVGIIGVSSFPLVSSAEEAPQTEPQISARANIIGWRFKNINGKAYKRQYDYTAAKWLGEWVPV